MHSCVIFITVVMKGNLYGNLLRGESYITVSVLKTFCSQTNQRINKTSLKKKKKRLVWHWLILVVTLPGRNFITSLKYFAH